MLRCRALVIASLSILVGCVAQRPGDDPSTTQSQALSGFTGPMTNSHQHIGLASLPDACVVTADNNVSETFDRFTNTWTATGPMTAIRIFHALLPLSDGRVLAAGGEGNTDPFVLSVLASTEIFDPLTSTWTAAAPLMSPRFARSRDAACRWPYPSGGWCRHFRQFFHTVSNRRDL
jgi:hypothetical protein